MNANAISMRHLRYMEALLRHGHFGRAAEACHISQPALSQQVRELEAILGSPLIERSGRGIRPTRLGALFVERAGAILRAVDDLADLAQSFRGTFAGPLRLGVIPTVAPYLLPDAIAALAAHRPDLDLVPREAVTRTLVGELVEGALDVAILALPLSEPALVEHPLFDEEFVLIRPAAEADAPVPTPDALREMRLLLLEEGHCFRDQSLAYCGLAGGRPEDVIEGSSLTTLVQLVAAGMGVTLVPEMATAVETRSAAVIARRLPAPAPTRTIGMVWRRSSPLGACWVEIAEAIGTRLRPARGAPLTP